MITGYMLIGPIGSAISIVSGLFSEYLLNKKVDEQRQQLRPEVEQRIDLIMEEYTRLLTERLHSLYQQIMHDMKQEQNSWFAAQDAALQQTSQLQGATPPWQQLIDEATKLQRTILTSLAKH